MAWSQGKETLTMAAFTGNKGSVANAKCWGSSYSYTTALRMGAYGCYYLLYVHPSKTALPPIKLHLVNFFNVVYYRQRINFWNFFSSVYI